MKAQSRKIVRFAFAGALSLLVPLFGCGGSSMSESGPSQSSHPVPAIASLSPPSILVGSGSQPLTVNGSGFISSSSVSFNGVSHAATFVNQNQLTITLDQGDLGAIGSFDVIVTNPPPGGGASASAQLTVAAAALTVNITDLPTGTPANVTVTDPSGRTVTLTSTQTIFGSSGTYAVAATSVAAAQSTYYPTVATQSVMVQEADSLAIAVDYHTAVPNTLKVLDSAGAEGLLVSADGSTLTISSSSSIAQSLATGDVLAIGVTSATPNGDLRKIVSVSQRGGQIVATTVQATFADAFQRADFNYQASLGPNAFSNARPLLPGVAMVRASARRSVHRPHEHDSGADPCTDASAVLIEMISVPIVEDPSGSIAANGQIEVCPTLQFNWSIGGFPPTLTALSSTTTLGGDIHVNVTGRYDNSFEVKIPILTATADPITVFVGPVPVVITPEVTFFVGANGEVSAGFSAGATQTASITAGISYGNGKLSPIFNTTSNFSVDPLGLDAGFSAKADAGVKVDLEVDGVISPEFSPDAFLNLDVTPLDNPWWTLSAGLEGSGSVKIGIFGFSLADFEYPNLFQFSQTVAQAGGGFVNSDAAPTLTALTPTSVAVDSGALTLSITGTNFVPGAVVSFKSAPLSTTYGDPTTLTAVLPAGALVTAGSFPVTVTNPDTSGATSSAITFLVAGSSGNPTPTVSSLSPSSLALGSASQALTIRGTGFLSSSTVTFGGVSYSPTVASANQLTITLTSADLSTAGSFPVVVTNPAPGGGASNAVNFVVVGGSGTNVAVTPSSAQVPAGGTQHFTAVVTGNSNTAVTWSVDGTVGGNSTVGTITPTGSFTAPATVPNPATIVVTATSQAVPTASGFATVAIGPYSVQNLYSFTSLTDGAAPSAALIQGSDGYFYGTAQLGGTNSYGTVFKVDSAGNVTSLYQFTGNADGEYPTATLVAGSDGALYGTTVYAGDFSCTIPGYSSTGCGTAFKIDTSGALTTLHQFSGIGGDGIEPNGLIHASDGNFYGTTFYGGTLNSGTVFRMDSTGNVTTLYSFSGGSDGYGPEGALIQGGDGYFYGTTENGGDLSCEVWPIPGCGTIFRVDSNGNLTTMYSFTGGPDGANPVEALIQGSDGFLYGTALFGGDPTCTVSTYTGCGSVFKIDPAGDFTTLHDFSGGAEGGVPVSALIEAGDGDFYGTATAGGDPSCSVLASNEQFPTYIGCGTVFKMDPAGNVNALYSFTGSPNDGSNPFATLLQGSDGFFYGTTRWGGTDSTCPYTSSGGCGTVFKVSGPGGPAPQIRRSMQAQSHKKPLAQAIVHRQTLPRAIAPSLQSHPGPAKGVKPF
jgi:uncharacterized repeat protein (TIGR03803 family)